jgi:hypothetical protein
MDPGDALLHHCCRLCLLSWGLLCCGRLLLFEVCAHCEHGAFLRELLGAVKAVFFAVVVSVLSAALMGTHFLDLDVAIVILSSLLSCAGGVEKRVFHALAIMLERLSSLDSMFISLVSLLAVLSMSAIFMMLLLVAEASLLFTSLVFIGDIPWGCYVLLVVQTGVVVGCWAAASILVGDFLFGGGRRAGVRLGRPFGGMAAIGAGARMTRQRLLVCCPWCGVDKLIALNKISRRSPAVISASVSNERRAVFRVAGVTFRWFVDAAALLGVNAVAIAFVDRLFVGEVGVGVAFRQPRHGHALSYG